MGPFQQLQRFADEMDRMFEDFGIGPRWRGLSSMWPGATEEMWSPQVDVYQKDDEFCITADLPGIRKEDISVDVSDDAITLRGERKSEHEERREGFYQSERRYGSFHRVIPLPAGAIADQAKATFRDGVLEVTMPAPPESTRGRRLEIGDAGERSRTERGTSEKSTSERASTERR